MSKTKPYPLPLTGVDSLSNETALFKGAVREAVNVDINRAGGFARRAGQRVLDPRSGMHSLWHAPQRGRTFLAVDAALYNLQSDNSLVFLAPLNSPAPLSYTEYNGNVYWASISTLGWLPADSTQARAVGVPTPAITPALSPGLGDLLPGRYAVVISRVDDRGEESGASEVQVINLPTGGGIMLSAMDTALAATTRVYITDPDGEQFHLAATLPAVFPTYNITETASGGECEVQFLKPLPPGVFIAWLAGRLYTAKGDTLWFSDAMRPHLHNPAHNFIKFSGYISFIEAVNDGMYVGDSRGVWFLAGCDPTKFSMSLMSSARAVRRSSIKILPAHLPDKKVDSEVNPVVLWLSTSGYMVGMDGGRVKELQPDRVKVPHGLVGRTTYLFRRGVKQVVTPVNSISTVAAGIAVDDTLPKSTP